MQTIHRAVAIIGDESRHRLVVTVTREIVADNFDRAQPNKFYLAASTTNYLKLPSKPYLKIYRSCKD
jgi:hypothetical protein